MRKRNVAKSVSHPHIYEYIDDRLRAAYLYFGNPQTKNGPLFTNTDIARLQKRLHETLKHKHEIGQCSTSSPLPSTSEATDAVPSCQDNRKKLVSGIPDSQGISAKEENDRSESVGLKEFVDKMGKSVLDSAISAVNNHIQSVTSSGNLARKSSVNSETSTEVLGKGMSSLLIDDSLEMEETVFDHRNKPQSENPVIETRSDSEHSEKEDLADQLDVEDSDESEESSVESEDTKTRERADKDLNSPTHTKCNGGIKGLYDESLLHGIWEEDFVFIFDQDVLFDGKV